MSVRRRGRNRRIKEVSTAKKSALKFGLLILLLLAGVIGNWYQVTQCEERTRANAKANRVLHELENELTRETAKLSALKTPHALANALLLHGIKMDAPKPYQQIRMNAEGEPVAGQYAVNQAHARRERELSRVADDKNNSRRVRKMKKPVRR